MNTSSINLNTWISVAGFALTIGGGLMAYSSAEARSEMRHAEAERRIEALEIGRQVNSEAIRAIQIGNATAVAENSALRREMTELKSEIRALAELIRQTQNQQE